MSSNPLISDAAGTPPLESSLSPEDERLVAALRAGDESAFMSLVELHGPVMLRIARAYVGSPAVAEEVVQEAWLGILQSLPRFQGRSSLKTWVLRILKNIASRRAAQERRSVPFSALEEAEDESGKPALGPERFLDPGERWAGHWASAPRRFGDLPEEKLLSRAALAVVESEMLALPPNQRAVIELRDVEGWEAPEVCELLEISEANQRVLLHRARSRVRRALEMHLDP
ncbi:MAG: sigma-70 family RNA polymerase sigma factor [Actinomycetota bacterium]|nr:sigma-70 family RNA polymerase sigma factor [Actinomycetota bacterium]